MSDDAGVGSRHLAQILSRRSFLGGIAAKAGLAPFGAWVAGLADGSTALAQTVRVRPEVHTDAGKRMLAIYRSAIGKMRSTTYPSYHPFAWSFQANIHGVRNEQADIASAFRARPGHDPQLIARWRTIALGSGNAGLRNPNRVWQTCPHGDPRTGTGHPDFLPWHRLYLAYFEEIIARVESTAFALPYWDYLDPAKRRLPPEFIPERVGGEVNWLRQGTERNRTFAEQGLTEGNVTALAPEALRALFGWGNLLQTPNARGFNSVLEVDLHGLVHVAIGGDMSSTATAARDPIFWIHHATVDWIWESWRHPGGAHLPARDPTQAAWLDRRFRFVDGAMTLADQHGNRRALRAEQNLRFRYDRLHPVPAPPLGAGPVLASGPPTTVQQSSGGGTMRKSGDSVTIELKPSVSEGVARGLAGNPTSRWTLELKLRAREEPGVYRVYVAKEGVAEPGVQIGSFGLFGASGHGDGAHAHHGQPAPGDVLRLLDVSRFVRDGTIDPARLGRLTVRTFHTDKPVDVTITGAGLVGR